LLTSIASKNDMKSLIKHTGYSVLNFADTEARLL